VGIRCFDLLLQDKNGMDLQILVQLHDKRSFAGLVAAAEKLDTINK
jgi:hypothetical protein